MNKHLIIGRISGVIDTACCLRINNTDESASIIEDDITCPICLDMIEERKKQMKNYLKSVGKNKVSENLRSQGASEFTIRYATHIIDSQRKVIKRLKSDRSIVNPTIQLLEKKIINQKKELSRFNNNHEQIHENRKCTAMSNRFMKIKYTNSGKAKITINPCSGRVELKLPSNYPTLSTGSVTKLLKLVSEYRFFDPFTYRGTIAFSVDTVYVNMRTDSKIEEDVNFSIALS